MRRAAFYFWLLPSETKPGKMIRSRWRMDDEQAKAHPGAQRLDETVEWREVAETPDEASRNQYGGGRA